MSYSKEFITETAGDLVKKDQLPSNKDYEWIDFVGVPQRPSELRNSLYCASYSDGKGGWDNGFDRRPIAEKVFISDKTFVLDTPQNRGKLNVRAKFLNHEDFFDKIKNDANGYIVYHKALATRQPNFSPEAYLNKILS